MPSWSTLCPCRPWSPCCPLGPCIGQHKNSSQQAEGFVPCRAGSKASPRSNAWVGAACGEYFTRALILPGVASPRLSKARSSRAFPRPSPHPRLSPDPGEGNDVLWDSGGGVSQERRSLVQKGEGSPKKDDPSPKVDEGSPKKDGASSKKGRGLPRKTTPLPKRTRGLPKKTGPRLKRGGVSQERRPLSQSGRGARLRSGRPSRKPGAPDTFPTPRVRSRAAIQETRALGKPSWASGKQFSRSDSFPRRQARSFRARTEAQRPGQENQGFGRLKLDRDGSREVLQVDQACLEHPTSLGSALEGIGGSEGGS